MTDQSFMQKYEPWGVVGYINMLRAPLIEFIPMPAGEHEKQAAINAMTWQERDAALREALKETRHD